MALKSPLAAYAEWNELPDKTDPVALHNMFARYIAHDVVLNGVPGGPVKGLDDAIAFQLQFGVAFPDLTFKVLSAGYADGNPLSTFILYEAVASMGTHTGPGFGTPTGKAIKIFGTETATINAEGKIQEAWLVFDALSVFTTIGVASMPAPVSTVAASASISSAATPSGVTA